MELSKSKKNIIYLGCCLLTSTVMLSAMGLNNTMFAILAQMNGLQYYSLMAVLSGFGTSIMCLVGSNLGQMYGRRIMSLIGASVALVCMIAMGMTNNLLVFILARALLSFGIGTFTALPYAICATIFTREEYTGKVGFLGSIMALTTFLGSTISGAMVDRGLIALSIIYPGICALAGALIVFVFLPKETPVPGKIDMKGVLCVSVMLAGFSYSFTFASSLGFGHWSVILGFVLTVVAAVSLYKVEEKEKQPLVPFRLFRNPKFTGLCVIGMLLSIYQLVMGIYVPVTGQEIMGVSATMTGFFSLPRTILSIVLPLVLAAWANKKTGNMRIGLIISGLCCTIPFVAFAFADSSTALWIPFVLLAITGIAEGYKGVCSSPLVVRQLQPQDIGIGIGLSNTCGSLGATFATPVLGAIYDAQVNTNMNGALTSVYWVTAAFGLLATLIAVFALKDRKEAETH